MLRRRSKVSQSPEQFNIINNGHTGNIYGFYLQSKAVRNFERVFLGAPFALEDGVSHDAEGVRAAQATQVNEGHRCSGIWSV